MNRKSDHLPQQRRFNHDEKTEAAKLLAMKVNKKLLQQHWTGCFSKGYNKCSN